MTGFMRREIPIVARVLPAAPAGAHSVPRPRFDEPAPPPGRGLGTGPGP